MKHDYSGRKIKRRKPKGEVYAKYKAPPFEPITPATTPSYADLRLAEQRKYKSVPIDSTPGDCSRVESKQYTGTLVKGISTMHKSNAVPIIDENEAKEHASMRR
jgi:hypothetical protein